MEEAGAFGVTDPLLWRRKDRPEANNQRGFAEYVAALDVDELCAEYEHDRRVAPRRSARSKKYFVAGHDGIPASGESTNRFEEHLALALFRHCDAGGRFVCPSDNNLRVVVYQVPLKARKTDQIGKIDLLGLLGDGRICVASGGIDYEGGIPFNTMGGYLSFGQVGQGLYQLHEVVDQMWGHPQGRAVPDVEIGIVHGHGGPLAAHSVMLLSKHETH